MRFTFRVNFYRDKWKLCFSRISLIRMIILAITYLFDKIDKKPLSGLTWLPPQKCAFTPRRHGGFSTLAPSSPGLVQGAEMPIGPTKGAGLHGVGAWTPPFPGGNALPQARDNAMLLIRFSDGCSRKAPAEQIFRQKLTLASRPPP